MEFSFQEATPLTGRDIDRTTQHRDSTTHSHNRRLAARKLRVDEEDDKRGVNELGRDSFRSSLQRRLRALANFNSAPHGGVCATVALSTTMHASQTPRVFEQQSAKHDGARKYGFIKRHKPAGPCSQRLQ